MLEFLVGILFNMWHGHEMWLRSVSTVCEYILVTLCDEVVKFRCKTFNVCANCAWCRFKGETQLEPSERIKIETKPSNGDVVSTLIIESLTMDDKGDIKVVGKNPAAEISATAKLNVIGMYCQTT